MNHFPCFAFRRENLRFLGQQVQWRNACFQFCTRNLEGFHTFKHLQERLFVQFPQSVCGGVSEQDIAGFHSRVVVFFAVNHYGHFLGKAFLQHPQMRSLFVFGDKRIYLVFLQRGEYLDIPFGVIVAHVHPELEELVRTGVAAVQPDVSAFGFAEFATIGFRNQRAGQRKCVSAAHAANQFRSCRDVSPLVATAHLQFAAFVLVQPCKVIAL